MVITKEIIKPSSPTPPHLKTLKLSFLDQLAPPTHIHIILYFDGRRRSPDLKRSFSEALAIYYPLAGRLRDNSWVDCNDEGAEYVEARFDGVRISDVVGNRWTEGLSEYVPLAPSGDAEMPLAVQVSFFGCGGTSIGICMSHKVADAASMVAFVNTWAAACSGDGEKIAETRPSFDVSSRFIPTDFSKFFKSDSSGSPPPPPQKIVTKIFTFDGEKLAAVKKAASGPLMEKPSKVEAISAFVWKNLIDSAAAKNPNHGANRIFTAGLPVDIRQRASPTLPQNFFGNGCARAFAVTADPSPAPDYYSLALKLREGIKITGANYARRLEDGGAFLKYFAVNEENNPAFKEEGKALEACIITSWSRLPAYEADFGAGKPVWVSIIEVPMKNLMFLLGTKTGDGIEAWVNMVEEGVAMIEANFHLLHI